ncbi:hypothetical protein HZS_2559 [Henneguya salminicola]|uniref:2-(3-amino-3-carboxypropyl)histidine synthase subunit 2 (Trinotate prediction) n=1 Tax=Henneguya salminicola TaxID=69463 RepID=A0A6G3MJY9_HENSL|nr:hypothetical protein HZS_2559 [Henneguya salminicola]
MIFHINHYYTTIKIRISSNKMAEVDTDSIIFYISQKDTRRVALQFPENLLEDGVKIYSILTKYFLNISFYVLADQTYSCCCVDEITAMHIIPDLIIHFGDACLNSKIHKYPVLYVFPCSSLNFNKFITFLTSEITPSPITILYESCFHHLKGNHF